MGFEEKKLKTLLMKAVASLFQRKSNQIRTSFESSYEMNVCWRESNDEQKAMQKGTVNGRERPVGQPNQTSNAAQFVVSHYNS